VGEQTELILNAAKTTRTTPPHPVFEKTAQKNPLEKAKFGQTAFAAVDGLWDRENTHSVAWGHEEQSQRKWGSRRWTRNIHTKRAVVGDRKELGRSTHDTYNVNERTWFLWRNLE
jgi:hypothetical protein